MESTIYRFKITNKELYEEMIYFANLNQFLLRKELKEKYEEWIELPKIHNLIQEEITVLSRCNYNFTKTSIHEKIFKSIKYYHINNIKNKMKFEYETEQNKEKPKKIKNIIFSNGFIEKVQVFLNEFIDNSKKVIPKPSHCCDLFIESNKELVENEKKQFDISESEFDKKLKKMIKNQYFMLFKK